MIDRKVFFSGTRAALPFIIVIIPFAMLFGVVGTQAGLTVAQAMGFSLLVIAGAAQFAAVQLMVDQAPLALVVLGALVVNARMVMYSAGLVPHLGQASLRMRALIAYLCFDQSFAVSVARYEEAPPLTLHHRIAYYLGVGVPIATLWTVSCFVGATAGRNISLENGFDFALPVAFIALFATMLRTVPHVVAALTSVVLALMLHRLPAGTGLLIAAFCAMLAGALTETLLERRT